MSTLQYSADYNTFIVWFEGTYPALHKEYQVEMLPAINESGIKVRRGKISADSHSMLTQLVRDYYANIKDTQ